MTLDQKIDDRQKSLDPQDWTALKQLGHRMVDDMLDLLQQIEDGPVWQPMPAAERDFFTTPVPRQPQGEEAAYEDFLEHVLPYRMGNIHPRFWGWVMGNGIPYAMLAEMLASGMNSNLGGGQHAAVYVENQVLDWFKDLLGYPQQASGLLTSGGSMANLVGLTVARNQRAGFDLRAQGLRGSEADLIVYASNQVHSSVHKAVELLGLGRQALREIAVDREYAIDLQALRHAIHEDRAAGRRPLCVVGNAGTTNTGAFDDLQALADLCDQENLWFHVDGAFGGLAALVPEMKPRLRGMERAHSLAFDLHKWVYMPFEVGCVFVRDEEDHRRAFSLTPDYLEHTSRGPASGAAWFSDYGPQLTRGFRALKVWMTLKAYGSQVFAEQIEKNIHQARRLAELVDQEAELERLAPVPLNIVCFRYRPDDWEGETLDELNEELLLRLQESGAALPSYTKINGHYALRVCITNYRTREQDLELLIEKVLELGRELVGEMD